MLHWFTQYILHCLHFTHNTVSKGAVCRPYWCERGGGVNIVLFISGSHLWTCVYQLSNTLVIESSCLYFPPILFAGLQLIVPKCCPLTTVSYEERDENHREPSPGGWWWVIKHFHRKSFRSLFVASAVCGRALSWRRTIPEDNIPRRWFWIKEYNYSTQSIFGGRLYSFGQINGLTTRS